MEKRAQDASGELQAAIEETRKRFLAGVTAMRPRLHRFCARMTGSALDGEDIVQETLAQAFYSLGSLQDATRLEPWLFRVAHNKCVDFLRRERRPREETVSYEDEAVSQSVPNGDQPADEPIDEALAALVAELPPMERACVLLKDVLDYRLAEAAAVVDSTVGGVKAALHRGRTKLREARVAPKRPVELDVEERKLVDAYVDAFNRRDWDALIRLLEADVPVELVGVAETTCATYFTNYSRMPGEWKFLVARVDGEPVIVLSRKAGDDWVPRTAVKLWWRDGKVARIRDYIHVDYLLQYSRTEAL